MPDFIKNRKTFAYICGENIEFFQMYPEKEGTMFRVPDIGPAIK